MTTDFQLVAESLRGFPDLALRPEGSVCLIVGPNGCGKSFLLRLLSFPWRFCHRSPYHPSDLPDTPRQLQLRLGEDSWDMLYDCGIFQVNQQSPSRIADLLLYRESRVAPERIRTEYEQLTEKQKQFVSDELATAFESASDDSPPLPPEPAPLLNLSLIPSYPTGILHAVYLLTAVAQTPDGGVLGFDTPETGIHPHSLHLLYDGIEAEARARKLTVLLATHSRTLLNEFRSNPQDILVFTDPKKHKGPQPVCLTALCGRDWLTHFDLGDLYAHCTFGAPYDSFPHHEGGKR